MRRLMQGSAVLAMVSGCVMTGPGSGSGPFPTPEAEAVPLAATALPSGAEIASFRTAVARVEPVAEALCRERTRGVPCDFGFVIDTRPGAPPNAFQTLDGAGRPVVGFTLALISSTRNMDEIAFVVGHETAHHILGHIPRVQESAMTGALVSGVLAAISGADEAGIQTAQELGATLGARRYSKDFELQADVLGTEVALRAGFDPMLGAAYFDRLPDPGDQFLGTHPPNDDRRAAVRAAVERLTGN